MGLLTVVELKEQSGLPGPRGNLELFYRFLQQATPAVVDECLAELTENTANSPEEFVGMCGVAGFALLHRNDEPTLVAHLRRYAAHGSWRVREAVAMALQELPFPDLRAREAFTRRMETPDAFVHRAIVAGLCEPKNLRNQAGLEGVIGQLERSTALLVHDRKLTAGEEALRKALGYAWSVALVESSGGGAVAFEDLASVSNRHVRWIVRENLKKNRLEKWNQEWVRTLRGRLG